MKLFIVLSDSEKLWINITDVTVEATCQKRELDYSAKDLINETKLWMSNEVYGEPKVYFSVEIIPFCVTSLKIDNLWWRGCQLVIMLYHNTANTHYSNIAVTIYFKPLI